MLGRLDKFMTLIISALSLNGQNSDRYSETVNTLIYMLAALMCSTFAIRAWGTDKRDPLRRTFMLFGSLTGIYFGSFTLYLLPGFEVFDYIHAGAGAFLPAASMMFFDRLLRGQASRGPVRSRKLWAVTPLLVAGYVAVHWWFYRDLPRASPAEVALAICVYGGFGMTILKLWHVRQTTEHEVERARLATLLTLLSGTVVFSGLESLVRNLAPVADTTTLGFLGRSMVLQGAFPPISAVLGTLFCYLLYQTVEHTRLLDLYEVIARIFTLTTAALVLVVMDGVSVIWIGSFSDYPVHATFQIFLASLLFLGLYDPLRDRIETVAGEWFNRPGRRLELTLREIDRSMAKIISLQSLDVQFIGRLQRSGRAPQVSLYLYNQDEGFYELTLERGQPETPLMRTIAQKPFTDGFNQGVYFRTDFEQHVTRFLPGHEEAGLRLRTMDAMSADLTIPIRSGDLVLGWVNLRDERWSDGYSQDEIRRLQRSVGRVAVIIENIYSFEQLKEQHRLAALGTMSAGLAHEIRNPLAGIKGAAQYLQGEAKDEEVPAFLEVIINETNRLDTVVSQFLSYARPFQVHAAVCDTNAVIRHTIDLVRAEGLADTLELKTQLAPGLPPIVLDPDKLGQMMLNLIKNALHAVGDEGEVLVRTSMGTLTAPPDRGNPAFVVSVKDSGDGIAPEHLEKLFIPFFTTKREGTGLGLAICRRMVEAHGGEIAVQSKLGEGSTFTMRFPLKVPEGDPDETLS
jgi:two-component system, NtrC family, sensor histidine kinase HydH